MVDAGRVLFQVGIDRPSLDRAIADAERRLGSIGDIDLKIGNQGAAAAVSSVQRLFDGIRVPEIGIQINTNQAKSSVSSLKTDVLDLETAIAAISGNRAKIDLDVKRGEASLARIEAQILRLERQKINIPVVTLEGAAQVRAIEAQIASLNARKISVEANTEQARAQLNQLDRTLDDLNSNDAEQALERLQQEFRQTERAARDAGDGAQSFNSVLAGFAGGAAFALVDRLVDAFGNLTQKVTEFVAASIQANQSLRATENALSIVLGSQEAAAESIDFLRDVSERTGQSFQALQTEYSGLTAAAAEAGVPQEQVNDLFAETSRVLAIFGKDSQSTGLAFNALTQITSKGVVSMEELRQQLGEQLPVAFGAVARGLGITTAELNDLVASGELTAAEFIPAFTRGLQEIEGAAPAAQQAIARLENSILEFQQGLGRAIEPLETAFSETFAAIFSNVDVGVLDPLVEAGNRLRDSLAENPELAERLGEALTNFIGSGAQAVANILDSITEALSDPENVERFAGSIENAGKLLESLVSIGGLAVEALLTLGTGFDNVIGDGPVDAIVGFVDALETIAPIAGGAVDSLGSIASAMDDISGRIPGVVNAAGNLARFGVLGGTAKTIFDNLPGQPDRNAQPEAADTSQFVPQQDELDKSVRASRQASETIAQDSERAARAAAAARVKANEEAIAEQKRAQEQALIDLEIAQNNRIIGVRENQSAGNITASQADSQIAEIESQAIRDRIALREQEIAQVRALEQQGALSAEEVAQRISAAKQAASELTIQAIEQEVQAQEEVRQAALDRLDAESQLNSLRAEQVNLQSDLAGTALQDQSALISAQVGLEQSRLSLSRQSLDTKLAEAQAAEDVVAVEALRDRILLNQRQSIAAEFSARRQQLRIQEQLAELDADRQLRLGQIAAAEARIAVERARIGGSSQEEIQGLQEIAQLREAETEALTFQAQSKENILALQFDQLDNEEELANQLAIQERRQQAIEEFKKQQKDLADEQVKVEKELASAARDRESAAQGIVSALSGLQDISAEDALGNLDQLEENFRAARRAGAIDSNQSSSIQRAINQAQSAARSGGEFTIEEAIRFAQRNENNAFASGILDTAGLGGVNSLLDSQQEFALAEEQISELSGKLAEVKEAIQSLPENLPPTVQNLNVTTPQPVDDAASVVFNLGNEVANRRGIV
ncbi:tape measure protein [Leptothoe sp. ISB3NOV94-8A]